jgi:hypothetical protein
MSKGEFNVFQFFQTGGYEQVRELVDVDEAKEAVLHYCQSVAAQVGLVDRVIITDSGDLTVFEWQFGKGITFPRISQAEVSEMLNNAVDDNQYDLTGYTIEDIALDLLAYADLPEGVTKEELIPLIKVWKESK